MDSLTHDIISESAFDIANSMINADINDGINLTTRIIDDGNSDDGTSYHQTGNMDFTVGNRLVVTVDDEESFANLVHHVTTESVGLNDVTSSAGVSTRLRRRKATQPQRLVYCDLDFNINEDANLGNINDDIGNEILSNGDTINANHYVTDIQCDVQTDDNDLPLNAIETQQLQQSTGNNTKTKSKGFSCEICGSVWNSKTRLRCHYRTHGAAKHLKCDICGKLFGWEYSWKTHMLAHSDDNPNKCPHCGLKLFNKTALTNHIKRIHDNPERPFKCPTCSKSFISKSELNQHSHTHNDDKPFMCEQCGKTFRSKSYMERHYRTHSGIKPFKCEYCGKLLADKTGFTAHVRAHVGERPYMCDICGKKYTIKRHLTSHMIIHSDLRPFKCEECGKTFRSRTNFRMHKDSHLGIKRWSCKFCNRTFLSQGNMAKHVRRHIGERKHKCEICEKAFIEKQELKNHLKMHAVHESRDNDNNKKTITDDGNGQCEETHSNTNEGSCLSNSDTNNGDINSLTLNHFREVLGNNETEVDDGTHNNQPLLTQFSSPLSSVQLPSMQFPLSGSGHSPATINLTQAYSPLENGAQTLDTSNSLSFCDFQRSETNRSFYGNSNQTQLMTKGSLPLHQQSIGLNSSFFPNNSIVTSTHNQYLTLDSTQQSYHHCSLCSGVFVSFNNLREHLIEFHRVESDKVLTMMF